MGKALVSGLLVLGMSSGGVAAASAKDDTTDAVSHAGRAIGKKCADAARVDEATLAITDMPTGFAEVPPPAPGNVLRLDDRSVRPLTVGVSAVANAYHAYSRSESALGGMYVTDGASVFASVKDAKTHMKAYRRLAALATTYAWTQRRYDPDGSATYTATAFPFPKIGDDTLAVRITGTFRDSELGVEQDVGEISYLVFRHGPVLSALIVSNADAASFAEQVDVKVRAIRVACPRKKPAKGRGMST